MWLVLEMAVVEISGKRSHPRDNTYTIIYISTGRIVKSGIVDATEASFQSGFVSDIRLRGWQQTFPNTAITSSRKRGQVVLTIQLGDPEGQSRHNL